MLSAVPLIFLVLTLALSLVVQSRNEAIAAGSVRQAQVLSQSEHANQIVENGARGILNFERTHNRAALAPYYSAQRELPGVLANLADASRSDPAQARFVRRMQAAYVDGMAVLAEYLRDVQNRRIGAAHRLGQSSRVRLMNAQLTSSIASFNNEVRAQTNTRLRRIRLQIGQFTVALVALCVIGIVTTLVVSIRFGLGITHRIARLAENAQRLAQGEAPRPIGGSDEITDLDLVYHEMTRRIAREQDRSAILQRALLPQALPSLPGIRLDAAYTPAAGGMEVGGDWYDVFYVSERSIGISIGDVAGHGLRAAAIMGSARQAIRTVAYIDDNPARVLKHVNELLCRNEGGLLVTAFFGTFDVFDGTLRYSVAGHPLPLCVKTGGGVEALGGKGFVLGVDSRSDFETFETKLEIGSALVLFTDGVVEAGRDYFMGLHLLKEAVEEEYRNAEHNIAEAIQRRVFQNAMPHDDSALLFMGITALGPSALQAERVTWSIDARSEKSARRVKRALLWRLGEMTRDDAQLAASELIVTELLGNVARHTPGPAEVTLEWNAGVGTVRVFDQGKRFDPPKRHELRDVLSESGRGLYLVHAIAQHLSIEWTGSGNCVSAVLPITLRAEQAVAAQVAR